MGGYDYVTVAAVGETSGKVAATRTSVPSTVAPGRAYTGAY